MRVREAGLLLLSISGWLLGAACHEQGLKTGGQASMREMTAMREEMVRDQIEARGIQDELVLEAMRLVERHRFVPKEEARFAYADMPLPIGHGQTISQPYIVALMSELAQVGPGDKVLEVGTGSGYQAAVLAAMGATVYSIEIVEPLARRAQKLLAELGYDNIHLRQGDGYAGWPEVAPFDAIVVTAAPPEVPETLKEQLAVGGRLVIPIGKGVQQLVVVERTREGFHEYPSVLVRFVPMVKP